MISEHLDLGIKGRAAIVLNGRAVEHVRRARRRREMDSRISLNWAPLSRGQSFSAQR